MLALAEENKQNMQCWNGPRQVYDQTFLYNYLDILFSDILGYVLSLLVVIAYLSFIFNKGNWNFTNFVIPFLWVVIPLIFYQIISVKGYHFLFSITPFLVIFGISILSSQWIKKKSRNYILLIGIIPLILISNKYIIHEYFK